MPSLVIPGAMEVLSVVNSTRLAKGQLYNLDLNEYIGFQFNPTTFEWGQQIGWAETIWQGDDHGGDVLFTHIGPRECEVSLLYMADPGAPDISWNVPERLANSSVKCEFQALRKALERWWTAKVPGKGRPSRIRIIVGPNYLDGVIKRPVFKINEFFEDLSVREAMVNLEFREWLPVRSLRQCGRVIGSIRWPGAILVTPADMWKSLP